MQHNITDMKQYDLELASFTTQSRQLSSTIDKLIRYLPVVENLTETYQIVIEKIQFFEEIQTKIDKNKLETKEQEFKIKEEFNVRLKGCEDKLNYIETEFSGTPTIDVDICLSAVRNEIEQQLATFRQEVETNKNSIAEVPLDELIDQKINNEITTTFSELSRSGLNLKTLPTLTTNLNFLENELKEVKITLQKHSDELKKTQNTIRNSDNSYAAFVLKLREQQNKFYKKLTVVLLVFSIAIFYLLFFR